MIVARLRPREENGRKFLQGTITVDYRFKVGTTVTLHKRDDSTWELIEWSPRERPTQYDTQMCLSFALPPEMENDE